MDHLTGAVRIHVRGVMGSGKSTFAADLAQASGIPVHFEPLENYQSLLEKAYRDPAQYREAAQRKIFAELLKHQAQQGIIDMTVEDNVFVFSKHYFRNSSVQSTLEAEYLGQLAAGTIQKPHLTIFLEPDPRTIHARIRLRRRPMEVAVSLADIQSMTRLLKLDRETNYRLGDYLVVQGQEPVADIWSRIEGRLYAQYV